MPSKFSCIKIVLRRVIKVTRGRVIRNSDKVLSELDLNAAKERDETRVLRLRVRP